MGQCSLRSQNFLQYLNRFILPDAKLAARRWLSLLMDRFEQGALIWWRHTEGKTLPRTSTGLAPLSQRVCAVWAKAYLIFSLPSGTPRHTASTLPLQGTGWLAMTQHPIGASSWTEGKRKRTKAKMQAVIVQKARKIDAVNGTVLLVRTAWGTPCLQSWLLYFRVTSSHFSEREI